MMRAVRLHGIGDIRVESIPLPGAPAAGEVCLRIRAAGICGSDLHNFRTGQWISRTPVVPGHEFAAEVLQVGSGVSGFSPGDLVVADSRVSCARCAACRAGTPNVCVTLGYVGEVCDGGFAERVNLPAARLLRVPPGVSARVAALAEPLGVALHVIRRLEPARGVPLLVAGAGPIGGLAAILLNHLGYGPLGILERHAARALQITLLSGAVRVEGSAAAVRSFAGAAGLGQAIEATGSQAMLSLLVESLAGRGRLAMVGLFHGQPQIAANALVERELDVRGCSVFCDEQREVLPLLQVLAPALEQVISPAIALEDLPAAYQRLLDGDSPYLKTLVTP
jgi:(R,R)-butanediol dehydrogenase/meso-butanediol dehydrogenase/diacetyl reductase